MQPVLIDLEPLSERSKFVICGNRAAAKPFVHGLGRHRLLPVMAEIEVQGEISPALQFFRGASHGELKSLGESRFFFDGWHPQIVQLHAPQVDNRTRYI